MAVSVLGLMVNFIMLIIIAIILVAGFTYNRELTTCETKESPYCYIVQCPCDVDSSGQGEAPCFGYTKTPGAKPGTWYCSGAPLTLVDNNGALL